MNTDRKAKLEKALANYNSDSMFSVENYKGALFAAWMAK